MDIATPPAPPLQGFVTTRQSCHSGRAQRLWARPGIQERGVVLKHSGSRLASRHAGLGRDDELRYSLSGRRVGWGCNYNLKELVGHNTISPAPYSLVFPFVEVSVRESRTVLCICLKTSSKELMDSRPISMNFTTISFVTLRTSSSSCFMISLLKNPR